MTCLGVGFYGCGAQKCGVATKDQLYKRPTPTKDQLVGSTKDQRLQKTNPTKDQRLQKIVELEGL